MYYYCNVFRVSALPIHGQYFPFLFNKHVDAVSKPKVEISNDFFEQNPSSHSVLKWDLYKNSMCD